MTCTICGRYADPDRETGYDADEVCPRCAEQADQDDIDPIESDLRDLGSVLASLASLVNEKGIDASRLFDVYCELGKLSKAMMELQDVVGKMQTAVQK